MILLITLIAGSIALAALFAFASRMRRAQIEQRASIEGKLFHVFDTLINSGRLGPEALRLIYEWLYLMRNSRLAIRICAEMISGSLFDGKVSNKSRGVVARVRKDVPDDLAAHFNGMVLLFALAATFHAPVPGLGTVARSAFARHMFDAENKASRADRIVGEVNSIRPPRIDCDLEPQAA